MNVCLTNKTHHVDTRVGRPIFDVNTKLAAGPTQVNSLLTSLNIPAVGKNTLKAREREVGPAVEKLAKRSCEDVLAAEKECWRKDASEVTVAIGTSYDMGWQKRGKGHNSLTGVGSMIGLCSGKVVVFGTRTKCCPTCEAASRMGNKPRTHDCRLNWAGSANAMEPDLASKLATDLEKHGAQVSVLIGDEDSSTIKKLCTEAEQR